MTVRAGAALALSGPYADPGRDAAAGLRAWAAARGVRLELADDRSDPARSAALLRELAGDADLLFGPYGSGPARAAAAAAAEAGAVLWNHGGAAVPRAPGARVVDVLGPAESYWRGLAEVLAGDGVPLDRVLLARRDTPFGRAVAHGAEASLGAAGARPLAVVAMERGAEAVAEEARRRAARAVVGGGRIEDDIALAGALAGGPWTRALVVAGAGLAGRRLGAAAEGCLGPSQWDPEAALPDWLAAAGPDYTGVQAAAAGELALRAVERARSTAPVAVWEAALEMSASTFLGPFRVDRDGRQTAHAPCLVRWRGGRRRTVWRPEGVP